jgi:hypothetical protein
MTFKMADMESLLCPICQNEIKHQLLEKLRLNFQDLETIEELLHENLLMQILEFGKIASRYLKPDTMTTDLEVHEALEKLSDRAEQLMEKQRQLAKDLVKESEDKRLRISEESMQKHNQLVADFQNEIKMLQAQHGKVQQDHKEEVEKMNAALLEIQKKIIGQGIGDIREATVIKDLKAACSMDEFSEESASKKGADIVGTVKENGNELGKIVVSVREREKWESESIMQVKKNLKEQQTDWGILVTKVFPSSALNDKMFLDANNILLVKTDYAPAAYMAMRHAVIYKNQAQNWVKNQQESKSQEQKIFDVLRSWVDGEELRSLLGLIDEANGAAKQADDMLQNLQTHNQKHLENARTCQQTIKKYLQQCSMTLRDLKEKLPITS